ncbi:MAG: hypothetical protein LUD69_01520 [Oscillospiraceae bacterium]|nr:hypothetical protein [Oscillospiraceae bacterium]
MKGRLPSGAGAAGEIGRLTKMGGDLAAGSPSKDKNFTNPQFFAEKSLTFCGIVLNY